MLVNNEVGTIQPLAGGRRIVAERAPRAVLHTDAVQASRGSTCDRRPPGAT